MYSRGCQQRNLRERDPNHYLFLSSETLRVKLYFTWNDHMDLWTSWVIYTYGNVYEYYFIGNERVRSDFTFFLVHGEVIFGPTMGPKVR